MKRESIMSNPTPNKLDFVLAELKDLLSIVDINIPDISEPQWPILSIIGSPRSGTSVLLQMLAATGVFAYPSNVLGRFAFCPYIAARIQQILFDPEYDVHGDFQDIRSSVNFVSDLGKSRGALAANEFQHFFRCYIPTYMPRYLLPEELMTIDFNGIKKGLSSIEHAFGKPFVTKAVLLQYNLNAFLQNIPQLMFLYIKRDPLYVMQSIYIARERYFGEHDSWWSVKPHEYGDLIEMDTEHQIAGQVFFTNRSIEHELTQMPLDRTICVEYESFCRNPKSTFRRVLEHYAQHNVQLPAAYNGPCNFPCQNVKRLSDKQLSGLLAAYNEFAEGKPWGGSRRLDVNSSPPATPYHKTP